MKLKDILEKHQYGYVKRDNNFTTNPLVYSFSDGSIKDIRRNNIIQDNESFPMTAYELMEDLQSTDFRLCTKYGKRITNE